MGRNLFDCSVKEIEHSDVVDFCNVGLLEGERLDYKLGPSTGGSASSIAKVVCAFANKTGGLIIVGVDEDPPKSRKPESNPKGQPLPPGLGASILQSCWSISPPVAVDVSDFIQNEAAPGLGFFVVRVDPSDEIPHSIGGHWYVRDHDLSDPRDADRVELQAMFERRHRRISDQENRAHVAIERLVRAMRSSELTEEPFSDKAGFIVAATFPVIADQRVLAQDLLRRVAPPGWNRECERVSDGVYSVENGGGIGWLADYFGIRVFAICPQRLIDRFPVRFLYDCPAWLTPRLVMHAGDDAETVFSSNLLRPLVYAVRAGHQCIDEGIYGGRIRLIFRACDLVRLPIIFPARNRRTYIVGANRTDAELLISAEMDVSQIGDKGWDLALRGTEQLLWAWGRRSETQIPTSSVLEDAEIQAFGTDHCIFDPANSTNNPHQRPANHDGCYRCRQGKKT